MTAPFEARTSRAGVTQINVDELAAALVPLTDPNIETAAHGSASRPAAANPTSGPHRYTIVVPNQGGNGENSIVNIGQAAPSRINDTGITGKTKSHVHWHTTEAATMTLVSLGIHTNEGFAGLDGTNWQAVNTGFMMTTNADSFLDAEGQMYVVSRSNNVVVRAQSGVVRVLADGGTGNVEVMGKNDVMLGGKHNVYMIADPSAVITPPTPKEKITDGWPAASIGKGVKEVMTLLDLAGTAQGLWSTIGTQNTISDDNFKSGWINDPNSTAKFWVDIAKFISTVGRYAAGGAAGQVKIYADTFAGMSGSVAGSLYGGLSASVTSPVSASLLGGTASVKGLAWTSVWAGMGASLKTLWGKADLKSEYGKAQVSSKQDVAIASKEGGATVKGKKNVSVSSDGPAAIHGKTTLTALGGPGDGHGIFANSSGIHVGMFTKADDYASPAPKKPHSMTITSEKLELTFKSGQVVVDDSQVEMVGKAISVEASSGNVTVKGSKVLLG